MRKAKSLSASFKTSPDIYMSQGCKMFYAQETEFRLANK